MQPSPCPRLPGQEAHVVGPPRAWGAETTVVGAVPRAEGLTGPPRTLLGDTPPQTPGAALTLPSCPGPQLAFF